MLLKRNSQVRVQQAPRVLIPVFPGNNCEYDTKRAFEKAGAVADTQQLQTLRHSGLKNLLIRWLI